MMMMRAEFMLIFFKDYSYTEIFLGAVKHDAVLQKR